MGRRRRFSLFPLALGVLIAIVAWPVFVACATAFGYASGEAWQLDAWTQEPKRRLLEFFSQGWIASIPIAAGLGLIAIIDWILLARVKLIGLFAGILLPIAGVAAAFAFWHDPIEVLPVFATTGIALAVIYRVSDTARRIVD